MKYKIKPDINMKLQVWTLEKRQGTRWIKVFTSEDLYEVRIMKDHLLKPPTIYTRKNNIPEKPIRVRGKGIKPKTQRIKMKRSELPPSLQ